MQIQDIVVSSVATAAVGRVPQGKRFSGVIVDKVQHLCGCATTNRLAHDLAVLGNIGMGHTVYDLLCADAVAVIAVVVGTTVYGNTCKLSALQPCQVGVGLFAVVVVQRIAVFIRNRRSTSASRMPRATGT